MSKTDGWKCAAPPGPSAVKATRCSACSPAASAIPTSNSSAATTASEAAPVTNSSPEVVEADNAQWLGKQVVGEINLACGHCDWCARGLGRHCPTRTVLGIVKHPGAFAEFLTLPEGNLREVPKRLSIDQAVFAEPVAAACEILEQVRIPKGAPVAVLGDGKLGLLIAQVLAVHGARVHLFGRHPDKLAIAARAGVETELSTGTLPRAAYRWVVDATGSTEGFHQAAAMTEPRGTLILKSTVHGTIAVDTAPLIVNEITLVGSRCGRFEPALKMLATRQTPGHRNDRRPLPARRSPRGLRKSRHRKAS